MPSGCIVATGQQGGIVSYGVAVKLDKLAELKAEMSRLEKEKKAKIDEIIADLAPEIDAVKGAYDAKSIPLHNEVIDLKIAVKQQIVSLGSTVKGKFLMAVYSKPRVTWDGKGLLGYMVAHPEIEAFKKVGRPSVSIRRVK